MTPADVLAAQSAPMKIWLGWMFGINALSVFFLRHPPARWVLAAMVANVVAMLLLLRLYGTGHHLSLPHVVFWTALLIYLVVQRRRIRSGRPVYVAWCAALVATVAISLAFDYTAVVRMVLK